MPTMMYRVSINYHNFTFTSLADACTFATLAKEHGESDDIVWIDFINTLDLEENNDGKN